MNHRPGLSGRVEDRAGRSDSKYLTEVRLGLATMPWTCGYRGVGPPRARAGSEAGSLMAGQEAAVRGPAWS
jgi:hypothetical protein